ncbi:MAG: tetratricopeptide repeat protein [Cyanobacteria bacterium]|jgi:tetratricopeptide (TPR) repeat protein|nr:tetratricopeptide repeat protein [Cyanobacteria bacterium GSL.Bin1]
MGLKQNWLISLAACAGMWSIAVPASHAQALLPHTLEPNFENLEEQGLALAQDAAQLVRFQQYDAALARAKVATQLAPEAYQPWFIWGSLEARNENLEQALIALKKAHTLAPEEPQVLFTLGSAYFQQGDYQQALQELKAGLELEPDSPEALFDMGNTHLKLGQYDSAIASYQKSAQLEAGFWPAINNIGLIEYEQGKIAAAMEKWRTAAEIAENATEPKLAIAVALYGQGKQQEAIKMAQAALRSDTRYANLEFLEENLWGEKLLADTEDFFTSPLMESTLSRLQINPPDSE